MVPGQLHPGRLAGRPGRARLRQRAACRPGRRQPGAPVRDRLAVTRSWRAAGTDHQRRAHRASPRHRRLTRASRRTRELPARRAGRLASRPGGAAGPRTGLSRTRGGPGAAVPAGRARRPARARLARCLGPPGLGALPRPPGHPAGGRARPDRCPGWAGCARRPWCARPGVRATGAVRVVPRRATRPAVRLAGGRRAGRPAGCRDHQAAHRDRCAAPA